MANIQEKPTITLTVTLELTEAEARALRDLSSYNHGEIIEILKDHLSSAYVIAHKHGLYSFLASANLLLPPIIKRIDQARKVFTNG